MSRAYSRTLLTLLLAFAVVFGGTVAAPPVLADDRTSASVCTSELALEDPLPASAKAKTPVLLVHGLWSNGGVWSENDTPMISALESVEGAAVVQPFDYESANDDWVTDGDTAQRLAKTIVCLSRLYGGKDVIVIAHSMGGLLTRAALDWAAYGTFAKKVTGHVVTIGTPHTGAPIAAFGNDVLTDNCNEAFVWWGQEAYENCATVIGDYAPAAMATGSRELAALPRFPADITVKAIAGEVRRQVCALWGCSRPKSTGGDLIVPVESATAEYTTTSKGDGKTVFACEDRLAILKLSYPWCEHSEMLKSSKVQDEVRASIKAYLAAASKEQGLAKTIRVGGLVITGHSTWKALDDTIIDTSTCELTSEGDFWKRCARVTVEPGGSDRRAVWDMLCADALLSTTKSTVGGKAATLYKYGRCDAYESPGTAYLWHVADGPAIEYHLSVDSKPMAGIEPALAAATWE